MSAKGLIIVGAGGFGREVLTYVMQVPEAERPGRVLGFLDDDATALQPRDYSVPVIGPITGHEPRRDARYLMAIGIPGPKLQVAEQLTSRGAQFATFVHPTAVIGKNVTLGTGAVVAPFVVITCDCTIGNFAMLNVGTCVGHDVSIGEGSTLSPHCDMNGYATLGRGVFLGTHAAVLPKVRVGDGAVVGAGSIVVKPVQPGKTVIGVPAKNL